MPMLLQPSYFMATKFVWTSGDVVTNQTFAASPHKNFFLPDVPPEFAQIEDFLARRNVELALEAVRQRCYPRAPARSWALYLSRTEADARIWTAPGSARAGYSIYEMAPDGIDRITEPNYDWFNYLVRLTRRSALEHKRYFSHDVTAERDEALEAYWEGRASEPFGRQTRIEVLVFGSFHVVRRMS